MYVRSDIYTFKKIFKYYEDSKDTKTMNEEPDMMYKLMILYMLDKVNFPLSNSQISSFVLGREYTTYFTLQNTLNTLIDDNFIHAAIYKNSTQYSLTESGKYAIDQFASKLSSSIKEDIDTYLTDNKYDFRCEINTITNYYQSGSGDYVAECKVNEGNASLIEIKLSVPSEEDAKIICNKWQNNNQDIYEYIMHKLT